MLNLYTNTDFLIEKHRREVFPLLFDLVFKKNKNLLVKYQIVETIEKADIVVCPINYETLFRKHKRALYQLLKLSRNYSKPIWILTSGDYGFSTNIPNVYTFRSGGFHSKLDENTRVLPSFVNDPYKELLDCEFATLPKPNTPSIGFVGHAKSGVVKYLKELNNHLKYQIKRKFNFILADHQPFYPSTIKRAKYLEALQKHKNLDTHFIFRNKYRAGSNSPSERLESSKIFYKNIFDNAYTFCLRGVGNFSVRFYETLAVGRIPILINTDCRLPLEHKIEWQKHCVIIDSKSKKSIASHVLEFHENVSNKDFETIQQLNRNLWKNVMQNEGFFLEIYEEFKTKLQ